MRPRAAPEKADRPTTAEAIPVQTSREESTIVAHEGVGGVITRASIARGRAMSPGIQKTSFYWRDVVHGPPPRRREKGDAMHVTFHATDDSGDARIAFTTIVRVDPGMDKASVFDDVVQVEERTYVQRRALQELIDRERAFTDRVCLRARSRLAHRLVGQRRFTNTLEYAWVASMMLVLIRLQAKVGNASIRGFRAFMRGLVAVPDAILTHTTNAGIHLGSRSGRKILRKAIRDPASATPTEKTLALIVGSAVLLASLFVVEILFTTFLTAYADGFGHVQKDMLLSLGSVLALPFPVEILLVASVLAVGATLAFTGLFIGKMIGSWMLYLLGDSFFDTIAKKTKTSPRLGKGVAWIQRNGNKYGFVMLLAINAIPFVPDLLIIVFAVSGMKFRGYMWGIGLGTAIKFAGIIAAVYLIGPETVSGFLSHPIATMRGS